MEKLKCPGTNAGKLIATMKRYGCGRAVVERLAKESNARVKLGKSVFYLWDRMDKHLEQLADQQNALS